MIDSGTRPIKQSREDLAAASLEVFLSAVRTRATGLDAVPIRHRLAALAGGPVRDPAADRDGRCGWELPFSDGRMVQVRMPGAALEGVSLVRDGFCVFTPGGCSVR